MSEKLPYEDDLIRFAQDIVRIPSYTGQEKAVAERIRDEMVRLGYDRVILDSYGSVVGVIGNGPTKILFDSHIDTVRVSDPEAWSVDPFGGVIRDGKLYGRGASDMKSSVAASVYGAYAMKHSGTAKGKTVYVCCSALEENFDGEGLFHVIVDHDLKPDYVVICEPTHLHLSVGQRGRALYKITTHGISAHGGAPEKGDNAIYKMAVILQRVEALQNRLSKIKGEKGSACVSRIESESESLNAVAYGCSIYIDRRLALGESEAVIAAEMDALTAGIDADWEICNVRGKSWTGKDVTLRSFLPAWEIKPDHVLRTGCARAFRALFGEEPEPYKWDFSTNGVASAKLGIPTIGFGAGIEKTAHMTDEYCPVSDILTASRFYGMLPEYL